MHKETGYRFSIFRGELQGSKEHQQILRRFPNYLGIFTPE